MSIETKTPTPAKTPRARGAIWLAVIVAIGWLIIGSAVGPLAGKLSEVQKNDNASFLPASAESTVVSDEQQKFIENAAFPLLIVVSSPDGQVLTPAQTSQANAFAKAIPSLPVEGGGLVSEYLDPAPIVPIPSEDGKAILINVSS